jgi:hypothetical protein
MIKVSPTFIVTLLGELLGEHWAVLNISVVAATLALGNRPRLKSQRGTRASAILLDNFMVSSVPSSLSSKQRQRSPLLAQIFWGVQGPSQVSVSRANCSPYLVKIDLALRPVIGFWGNP